MSNIEIEYRSEESLRSAFFKGGQLAQPTMFQLLSNIGYYFFAENCCLKLKTWRKRNDAPRNYSTVILPTAETGYTQKKAVLFSGAAFILAIKYKTTAKGSSSLHAQPPDPSCGGHV